MTYSISNIAEILGVDTYVDPSALIDILLTDSRSLTYPERSLFFAITTESNDGHRFIPELYERGVRNFVVNHLPADNIYRDANFLVVPDTTAALQKIARHHRERFDIPVIGITGSRGKTTVKEWLYQLLHSRYNIVRSPRSYNSQIGVPLSIWEMDPATRLAIFEAGISLPGEMAQLQAMISPEIGIITNIGDEHSAGFSSQADKCREKVSLLAGCRVVVYNGDDPLIADAIKQLSPDVKRLYYSSTDAHAPVVISDVVQGSETTTLTYSYQGGPDRLLCIPFTTPGMINNAMLCAMVMMEMGIGHESVAAGIASLRPVGTRLNVVEGINDCLIVHDSYTADLRSMAPAIDFMERHAGSDRQVVVILSDVMHENIPTADLYREMARLLSCKGISRVIGIGDEISAHSAYFSVDAIFFHSVDDFLATMSPGDFSHEVILVKGAPQFCFGRIVDMLEARRYETVLDVNLDALIHNYNCYKRRLRPSTGIVCMLKAFGYGAGSYELAKALQQQGASYLGVAVTDEGVDLRNAGITMPIMVLNPRVDNYKDMFTYRLEPEIYSFQIMDDIIREAEKYGISDYPVHIKLDTGMHRLGFTEQQLPELHARLLSQSTIRPVSVFSHLATADCVDMDDYTLMQLSTFDRCCERLQQGFPHHILRHILNTAGIVRFPEYQYDMVRLGIGLYGVDTLPPECGNSELRTVSSLHTVVIAVSERQATDTIGYSRRGRLSRPSRIATCPVGYADGLNRHLGNGRLKVMVNGRLCPIVGNICMDICMVDVTDLPECNVGDPVEIFGDNVSVHTVANLLDTIPYEVLTSVSARVKRVYYRE